MDAGTWSNAGGGTNENETRMVVAMGSLSSSEAAAEAAAPTATSSTAESCSTLPPQIYCRLKVLQQRLEGVKDVIPSPGGSEQEWGSTDVASVGRRKGCEWHFVLKLASGFWRRLCC